MTYAQLLSSHVFPFIGKRRVAEVGRETIHWLLTVALPEEGASQNTIVNVRTCLSATLHAVVLSYVVRIIAGHGSSSVLRSYASDMAASHALAIAASRVHRGWRKGVVMRLGTGRILTTHSGSLPRPSQFLSLVLAREAGEPVDEAQFTDEVRAVVRETVRLEAGANPASLVQVMLHLGEMVTATQSVNDETLQRAACP